MAPRIHMSGRLINGQAGRVHITRYPEAITLDVAQRSQEDYLLHHQRFGTPTPLVIIANLEDFRVVETVIRDLDIERKNARQHLSFGFGIHRCMGNRLAELQLRILWEEVLKRFEKIEVLEEPERSFSAFVKGYTHMPVKVTRKQA